MLREETFFGIVDKVEQSIERIKMYEPEEGYYLAFSGGKDSIVIKKLADLAGVKYDAHYNVTTIDPPELTKYIKDNHKDVIWDFCGKTFLQELIRRGFPTRQGRWCCAEFKEKGGEDRFVLTGIRWEESNKRAQRKMTETCNKLAGKHYLHPIIDWTSADIWEFIALYTLPYCSLYDKGWKRLGCLLCPMSGHRAQEASQYPKYVKAFIHAFEKRYEILKTKNPDSIKRWKSGKEMFNWWMSETRTRENKDQFVLFE